MRVKISYKIFDYSAICFFIVLSILACKFENRNDSNVQHPISAISLSANVGIQNSSQEPPAMLESEMTFEQAVALMEVLIQDYGNIQWSINDPDVSIDFLAGYYSSVGYAIGVYLAVHGTIPNIEEMDTFMNTPVAIPYPTAANIISEGLGWSASNSVDL